MQPPVMQAAQKDVKRVTGRASAIGPDQSFTIGLTKLDDKTLISWAALGYHCVPKRLLGPPEHPQRCLYNVTWHAI